VVNLLEPEPDDQAIHHELPIARLVRHAAARHLRSYRLYHGRSHLLVYSPAPGRAGGRCRACGPRAGRCGRADGAAARRRGQRFPAGAIREPSHDRPRSTTFSQRSSSARGGGSATERRDSMSARSVRLAGALVGAVAAVIALPSAASAALTPTTLEAQPYLLKFNDVNLQAWVPIRPSAFLYQSSPKVPLAGQVVEFFAGGKGLCAVKTDVNGYAECPGPVRVLFPTLNFGYTAKFPGTSVYAPSSDKGPIIKLGSVSIPG